MSQIRFPRQLIPPIVLFLLAGVALILALITWLRFDWKNSTDLHRLAICAGSLLVLILLTPIQELDKSRTDNPRGIIVVGFAAVALLFLLYKKIGKAKNKTNAVTDVV